ncbi:MAG: cytidine deaminase [Calditrichaceae bacterium]
MPKYDAGKLIDAAKNARKYSQAKYSNFRVGAALLDEDGQIFSGCNIESSSYSLTICAERVALTKALSQGVTKFRAIAITAIDGKFCSPCGACRQLLYDYAPEIDVILTDGKNQKILKLRELLPYAFEESQLSQK